MTVKGLHITADKVLTHRTFDSLQDYQRCVDGHIEAVVLHDGIARGDYTTVFVNEEGKIYSLPYNSIGTDLCLPWIGPRDYIAGDCVVVGPADRAGESLDITEWALKRITLIAHEAGGTWRVHDPIGEQ